MQRTPQRCSDLTFNKFFYLKCITKYLIRQKKKIKIEDQKDAELAISAAALSALGQRFNINSLRDDNGYNLLIALL